MALKPVVIAAAAVALFGNLVSAYPPHYNDYDDHYDDHAPTPYHFEYGVKDLHTHDIKSQRETSDGHGNVKGSYSLLEADGSTRVVEYTAGHEGFNAVVKKIEAPRYHAEYAAPIAVDYYRGDESHVPYYKYYN